VDELTDLLERARRGDRLALAAFVRTTQPAIWRFCVHLVGRDEADDVTQETYLAAWRALPSFRGEASARTWLFVIARRTATRVAYRRDRWHALAAQASPPAAPPNPAHAAEVNELLSRLGSDRKIAIVLTQIMGFSYAETATILECPIGTVRSRVARARGELLSKWVAEGDDLFRGPGKSG
jgi:RNA polymerase sigma-70 factor (ECF subfamily)